MENINNYDNMNLIAFLYPLLFYNLKKAYLNLYNLL